MVYRIALSLWLLLAFGLAGASDEAELRRQCESCHGPDGYSRDPRVPTIAGLSAISMEESLLQYREGARPADRYRPEGGEESDMVEVAKALSRDEIVRLAEHYAALPYRPMVQPFDAALAAKGEVLHRERCEKCHTRGGSNPDDDASLLAGQGRAYLERQFQLILSGERVMPKKMRKRIHALDPEDVEALVEYYVSRR